METLCPRAVRGRHVFLSPHFDDAVGSCGGFIAGLVEDGSDVRILTMFGGEPDGALSPAARELHRRWGDPVDSLALRREEDRAAAAVLGCAVHAAPIPEALYRRSRRGPWLYPSLPSLFRPPDPEDRALIPRFGQLLSGQLSNETFLYAPLGIGDHVDHQVAAALGQRLRYEGRRVLFYEDFPYLLDKRLRERRLRLLPPSRPCVAVCSERHLAVKVRAFAQYTSQLASLFPDGASVEGRVAEAARASGCAEGLGERYWRLRGPFRRSWGPRTVLYRLRSHVRAHARGLFASG